MRKFPPYSLHIFTTCMDYAGEMTYWAFSCSWSNSGQIARRRWYESPEGDFFLTCVY